MNGTFSEKCSVRMGGQDKDLSPYRAGSGIKNHTQVGFHRPLTGNGVRSPQTEKNIIFRVGSGKPPKYKQKLRKPSKMQEMMSEPHLTHNRSQ